MSVGREDQINKIKKKQNTFFSITSFTIASPPQSKRKKKRRNGRNDNCN